MAGYSGLARDAYTRRADIECFSRHLESLGRAQATIARRLGTVTSFCRYTEQEGLIAVSPAASRRYVSSLRRCPVRRMLS